jgi:dipeptidyl aminopeptidase/acylaminoacyl peptidase
MKRIHHARWFGLVALAFASCVLAETTQRAITHEDVWLMKRVGSPVVSPDGQWAVFPVTEPAYQERDQWNDLWVVRTDGSAPPRKLTSTRRGEGGAAWSPDSRKLAFSSRREDDETDQIYVIDVIGGGEARRVTKMSAGARAPRWRPDGGALLFTGEVFPSAATEEENKKLGDERKERKYNARVYDSGPIRHWDRWLDEKRPTLYVQEVDEDAQPRNLLANTQFMRSPGYGGRLGNEGDLIDATWTPDGTAVVFAATVTRNEWAFAEDVQSFWLVPAAGGEPRRLTSDKASYEKPVFSKDGATLYAQVEAQGEKVYNLTRVAKWSWPAFNNRTVLTPGFDRSVSRFALSPDDSRIYLLAEDAGHEKLYTLPVQGGAVSEVGALRLGCFSGLTGGGDGANTVLIANWESATSPNEVGRIDPATGQWRALTTFNAERVAAIDWRPLQTFTFTSSRGRSIHNLIALPPDFDPKKKYPLFVVIHGGPHTMWRDQFFLRWNYHLLAQPGYVVLLTNYSGSTGFGERFAQAIQGDPLKGPASEINEAADEAIRRFSFIDSTRQAAGGASYGGHLANWLAVSTKRYKALVSHAGLFDLKTQWSTSDIVYSRERSLNGPFWDGKPLWRDQSPLYRASNLSTPMLVTVGERDYRVPMNNALELFTVLQRQKVPSRLIVFPEENHWVLKGENSRYFYSEVHGWLQKYLQ